MKDIAASGLKVIPSMYIEKDECTDLRQFFRELKTEKLVIKPCVSAGAKNTMVLDKDNAEQVQDKIRDLVKEESFIVQPFVEEILQGEWSFLFFNGRYSHSLLKVPKAGDFRVQHYHGGSILVKESLAAYIKSAGDYVDQFAKNCLYARVDGVVREGTLQLMELELIEPYLFFNTHPPALENYYTALLHHLK